MGRWRSGGASCDAYAAMHCEACGQENIDGARFCAKCGALLPVEEHKEDPLIGQVIGGRYRITGVLGEGGMGIVYVAEQQMGSTLRKVAVKTLHPHLSQDPSVLARFHRECGTVAQLEHPNTIKFYDFGATADGTLYIAMEFVKGKSLMDVIEEGPIAPARTLKIMKQVCGALDEAHKLGIIHRDLKPENIILTDRAGETDFVKVLDFGIAARTESSDAQKEQKLTQQGMVLGTPPYMSPEQFTGKELDARSDIYSLGVMSYEMLTGRLPFEADTPWQWATQHMTAQPIPFDAAPSSSSSVPESDAVGDHARPVQGEGAAPGPPRGSSSRSCPVAAASRWTPRRRAARCRWVLPVPRRCRRLRISPQWVRPLRPPWRRRNQPPAGLRRWPPTCRRLHPLHAAAAGEARGSSSASAGSDWCC